MAASRVSSSGVRVEGGGFDSELIELIRSHRSGRHVRVLFVSLANATDTTRGNRTPLSLSSLAVRSVQFNVSVYVSDFVQFGVSV